MSNQPLFGDERLPSRFWAKVALSPDGCWLWTASKDRKGYGFFGWMRRVMKAHRVAYSALVAPIPVGLDIDHLCHTKSCVNPSHLEPVTAEENNRRKRPKAHCPEGHEYTRENSLVWGDGYTRCRQCQRTRKKREVSGAFGHPQTLKQS